MSVITMVDDAKQLNGLSPQLERELRLIAPEVIPHLDRITEAFYEELMALPTTSPFLEGRLDQLKKTHRTWLETLLTDDYDGEMAQFLERVGRRHVEVGLPLELMVGAMTILQRHLQVLLVELFGDDPERLKTALLAVTAALGFSLQLMQQTYHLSAMREELNRFLEITGISPQLFHNLAKAYEGRVSV